MPWPSVTDLSRVALDNGAVGITVHPRRRAMPELRMGGLAANDTGAIQPGKLMLYLDRYADNAPVTTAAIELEIKPAQADGTL